MNRFLSTSWRPLRSAGLAAAIALGMLAATPRTADAQIPGLETTKEWAGAAWDAVSGVAGSVWHRAATYVLPEAPLDWLPERMSDRDLAFVAAMQAAGYRLATAETGGGLLPNVSYRFVLDREPTPPDIERARVLLEDHRSRFWSMGAMAQRRLLETLIDASASRAMRVTAVEVALRPLPWVRYEMAATDRPLEDVERLLLDRLTERMSKDGTR